VAGIGGFVGNPLVQQVFLYNAAGAILGTALAPFQAALQASLFALNPTVPLSADVAADAVLRAVWDRATATEEAKRTGVSPDRFAVLAELAGNAPDPTSLALALRLKLIDQPTYVRGIRQGRLRDEWAPLVQQLSMQRPSPQAVLDAYLEGQTDEGTARDLFARFGGDPAYFDLLYNTQGQAPSPVQAADMANRGIIPWTGTGPKATTFEQAFLEGPWRNKWLGPMRQAAVYQVPPRTITAMYNEGSIDRATAIGWLKDNGLTDSMAAAYVSSGASQKTQTTRDLSVSTIRTLYSDQLIDASTAGAMLESLGYDSAETAYILAIADLVRVQHYIQTAVTREHALYTGHKRDRNQVRADLIALQIAPDDADGLLSLWDIERLANVKVLTPAEVASAYVKGLYSEATALAELRSQGYQPYDAWVYLAIHAKEPLTTPAPPDTATPGPGPVPGG
jgi:hypothetical protein